MVPMVIVFLFAEDDDALIAKREIHLTVEALFLYVITIQLQVNKTAASKRLSVSPAKPAPESVSKINSGFAKPA